MNCKTLVICTRSHDEKHSGNFFFPNPPRNVGGVTFIKKGWADGWAMDRQTDRQTETIRQYK